MSTRKLLERPTPSEHMFLRRREKLVEALLADLEARLAVIQELVELLEGNVNGCASTYRSPPQTPPQIKPHSLDHHSASHP